MTIERSMGTLRPLDIPKVKVPEGLRQVPSRVRSFVAGIIDPPYPTYNGKPLEVRHYRPGEAVLFDARQTRILLDLFNKGES